MHRERNSASVSLIAGSCSGILSTMALYPMDVLRTKMQTGAGGPIQVFRHTILHGGVRALYTGMALPLAAQAVYKGTVFSVNNITQNLILDYHAWRLRHAGVKSTVPTGLMHLTLMDRFWCGFVGGAVNGALFVTPVEFVRNQLIAQHSKLAGSVTDSVLAISNSGGGTVFRGSWDVIQHAFQSRNVLSLWRGVGWTIGRDGIGCGFFFLSLAWAQQMLTPIGEPPSLPVKLISGGLAGFTFWAVSLPMDSIKTWVQSSDLLSERVSVKGTIQKIYSESGVSGVCRSLLRGWQVAYGRGIPSAALTIAVYTFVYDALHPHPL